MSNQIFGMSMQRYLECNIHNMRETLHDCNLFLKGELKGFCYYGRKITTKNEVLILMESLQKAKYLVREHLYEIYAENQKENELRKQISILAKKYMKQSNKECSDFVKAYDPLNLTVWLNTPLYNFYGFVNELSIKLQNWSVIKILNLRD